MYVLIWSEIGTDSCVQAHRYDPGFLSQSIWKTSTRSCPHSLQAWAHASYMASPPGQWFCTCIFLELSWNVQTVMIPQRSWTREKPGKTFIQGFFEPYNFPKGWGQVSNKYIQHIYSYSTLSNYSKAQHGRANEFANTIGTHQRSLHNRSGNDAISGGLRG